MTAAPVPHIDGVLSAAEIGTTADHLVRIQTATGMIPWFPGGHCDPWNHVESAMALDVAGRHREARAAYDWLARIQREDGSWFNYYLPDGKHDATVEDPKLDTNVNAYVATGVWHHLRATGDRDQAAQWWPMVDAALSWVLRQRRSDGLARWAVHLDTQPWEYALLTGTCSIIHSLRSGAALAAELDIDRSAWCEAAATMARFVVERPDVFEPKERWAMDWYYPVLASVLPRPRGVDRLADGFADFVMDGKGVRCVSDEPWVTASETGEAAIAYAVAGDVDTATELLDNTRSHRLDDGAYLTGIVYPDEVVFPAAEHTSYTAAAVILAADAITGATPASSVFVAH